MSLCPVVLDTITLVLEEELAVSRSYMLKPRARSSKFLIPCAPVNMTLVLERSKRQIPSLESTTPRTNHGGRIGERIEES
jgi:hypothetical protein